MFPVLSTIILTSIVGAILVYLIARYDEKASKVLAITVTTITFLLSLYLYLNFQPGNTSFQFVEEINWVKAFGMTYTLGLDGISLPLVMIATFLTTISAASSWNTSYKTGKYFSFLLIFEVGIVGVFSSLNLILFYFFWELALIPMFFLIIEWGGPRRTYAAIKFLIYTHVGAVTMLLGFMALYAAVTPHTFNIIELANANFPMQFQLMVATAVFFGFAVKIPVVPLHTWLPDAHVEAPAPISLILAGLLLKMGGYGFIRVNYFILPEATKLLSPIFVALAIFSIFYGAIVAMIQQDLKRMIALTSINHMGFVLLGAAAGNADGIAGAVFQMFNHGVVVGLLFLLSGIIHEHAGTRTINELKGLGVKMPMTATLLMIGSFASFGFPFLNSFISEFTVLVGAISAYSLAVITVLAPAITAGYFLWMLNRVVFSPSEAKPEVTVHKENFAELLPLMVLVIPIVLFGTYPSPILNVIYPTARQIPRLLGGG